MRSPIPCLLSSVVALVLAVPACSSDSDTTPSTPSGDAGLPDTAAEASPDTSVPDAPVQESGTESGAESGVEAGPDAEPDVAPDAEPDVLDLDGGTLPSVPDQAGVVYAAHYHSGELIWYRTDGTAPRQESKMDMGAYTHDMALDPLSDRLYVAHDVAKKVEVYALGKPSDSASPTPQPTLVATIDSTNQPYFVRVNPYRKRLYVLQSVPGSGGPVTEAALFIYDVTDPSTPVMLSGSPHTIPSTASLDIDPVRDLLFLYHGPTKTLHGFDLHGDDVQPIGGGEIALQTLYPQTNTTGFQARNLTVDPYTNRIYAARPQGGLSEVIALTYPAFIPTGAASWSQVGSMTDLVVREDPFDVNVPMDERPHLLDAFTIVPDPLADAVFFVGSSWNGTAATALVLSMPTTLDSLDEGCGAFEGFGCWYRTYNNAAPGTYLRTDSAACADLTHQVFVGTSVDSTDETDPGMLHFFSYDDARNLEVWLPDGGGNVMAGALPISVICH